MAVYQFIYDDFNDNVFDTPARWTYYVGAPSISETGGRLLTPAAANTAPNVVYSRPSTYGDISRGRMAYQLNKSGTINSDTYLYFGLVDGSFKQLSVFGRSNDTSIQAAGNDTGTGTATQLETTIGLGTTLPANIWLGWDYNTSTKTYTLSKSTDAVTWTGIWKYVVSVSGSFDWKRTRFMMGTSCYGVIPTFLASWDNPSYFATDTQLKIKYRTSSNTWADASVKYRSSAGTWKRAVPRFAQGTGGSAWARPNP